MKKKINKYLFCFIFLMIFLLIKGVGAEEQIPTINLNLVSSIIKVKENPQGDYIKAVNTLYRSQIGKKLENINRDFKYYFSNGTNYSSYSSATSFTNSLRGEISRPFIFGSSLSGSVNFSQYINKYSPANITVYPSLNLSMPLDFEMMTYNDFSANSTKRDILKSELSLINTEKTLVENILDQYFSILTSLSSIKHEEEKFEFYQKFNKAKTVEVQLGKTREMVLLETEVQSLQSKNNLMNLRESLNDSLKNFKQLLNLSLTANIDLSIINLENIPYDDYVIPSLDNAIMSADLVATKIGLDEQGVSLKSLRSKVTPSFSVNTNANSDISAITRWPFSVYASVNLPLFNEADYQASFDQQSNQYKDSLNSFEKQKTSRKLFLQNLVNTFNTNLRNYRLAKEQLDLQKKLCQIYDVQYNIGQLSLQIYIDRRNSLTDQQNNYYSILQKLFISYSKLIIELEGLDVWYDKILRKQLRLI
ncbi:MAG: TolC family protein [Candidatus Margulisiibacteriota bacterium]